MLTDDTARPCHGLASFIAPPSALPLLFKGIALCGCFVCVRIGAVPAGTGVR